MRILSMHLEEIDTEFRMVLWNGTEKDSSIIHGNMAFDITY